MKITDTGIDTIQAIVEGKIDKDKINNRAILSKEIRYTLEDNTKLPIIVSLQFGDVRKLSTVDETHEVLEELEGLLGLDRLDIAVDFMELLEEKKNLFRMILECYARQKKFKTDVFKTVKGIAVTGNMKISNNRTELTIYNHTDKVERLGNSRMEIHNKDLRIEQITKKVIREKIENYIKELKEMLKFQGQVEREYIEELARKYEETKGISFINFSEFIAWADCEGYILTSGILKGLLKSCGMKITFKSFVQGFKKTRKGTLNFTTEKELKDTVKMIEKELKKCVKN